MKQYDKNTLIGFVLIAVILIFFLPQGTEEGEEIISNTNKKEEIKIKKDSIATGNTSSNNYKTGGKNTENNVVEESEIKALSKDTVTQEQEFVLENDSIKLTFSNLRGEITSAAIKGYYSYDEYIKNKKDKTYKAKDIDILNKNSKFEITSDGNISKRNRFFTVVEKSPNSIVFRKEFDGDAFIEYKYTLNRKDENLVDFTINSKGINNPKLKWEINTPKTEKSAESQEEYTGIYYQGAHSKDINYTWNEEDYKASDWRSWYKFWGEEDNRELNWIAFKQQFFSTIISSKNKSFDENIKFKAVKSENEENVKSLGIETPIDNGINEYSIYFGPNSYEKLKAYDKSYEEIIPLGWGIFGWVNRVIVINLFDFLSKFGYSYGLIILLLTLIIKIGLSPFTYKAYLSQAKMKVLKPEIDKINEKHKKKDPMKAQQETMGLYRKAGVNPMGGCLPMLFQFPILIAMFRFFPASLELRQESFLWADDLSAYDVIFPNLSFDIPFYGDHISLFTLLMTISTLMYTHMNSSTMASTGPMAQMKWMMYLMPIMFLGFFNNFAASLCYYYFLANMFTFTQQYFMKRFIDEDAILAQLEANKKKPAKPKSKFQKKLEEMQKKQEQQMKKKK